MKNGLLEGACFLSQVHYERQQTKWSVHGLRRTRDKVLIELSRAQTHHKEGSTMLLLFRGSRGSAMLWPAIEEGETVIRRPRRCEPAPHCDPGKSELGSARLRRVTHAIYLDIQLDLHPIIWPDCLSGHCVYILLGAATVARWLLVMLQMPSTPGGGALATVLRTRLGTKQKRMVRTIGACSLFSRIAPY